MPPETGEARDSHAAGIRQVQGLAWLLDSSIRLPIVGWRIGLDGLIGLIPGVGDGIAGLMSSYILGQAVRMGTPWTVVARMTLNVVGDTLLGAVPVIGDLFDFVFKANQRNAQLLLDYQVDPARVRGRSIGIVAGTVVLVIALVVLAIYLAVVLLGMLLAAI